MQPLTQQNIESELSYAYLHAIASNAGMSCNCSNRSLDDNGVDATVTAWGPFTNGGYLNEVAINIQLKATVDEPVLNGNTFSYFLKGLTRYNDLRSETIATPRLLVVLYLPRDSANWLELTEESLVLKKCAYWVSLRGAAPSQNSSGETVRIPKAQLLTTDSLKEIAASLSRHEIPTYATL